MPPTSEPNQDQTVQTRAVSDVNEVETTVIDTTSSGKIRIRKKRSHSRRRRSRFRNLDISGLPRTIALSVTWTALALSPFLLGSPFHLTVPSLLIQTLLWVGLIVFVADRFLHHLETHIPPLWFALMGVALFMIAQAMRWPEGIVALLSPDWNQRAHAVLDGLGLYGQHGVLSLATDGVASRFGAAQALSMLVLFLLVTHFMIHKTTKRAPFWILSITGFVTTLLAAVHMALSAKAIYTFWPLNPIPALHFFGPFPDNHVFGLFLAVSLLFQVGMTQYKRRLELRLMFGFFALCTGIALLLTFSAVAWLSLLAALLFLGSMLWAKKLNNGISSRLLEASALLLGCIVVFVSTPLVHRALGNLAPPCPAVEGPHWHVAWELIRLHPLTGLGVGGFAQAATSISSLSLPGLHGDPQNLILQILLVLGLPLGLLLMLLFAIGLVEALRKEQKRTVEIAGLAGMILILWGCQFTSAMSYQALALPFVMFSALVFGRISERVNGTRDGLKRVFASIVFKPVAVLGLSLLVLIPGLVGSIGWMQGHLDKDRERMAELARSRDLSLDEFSEQSAVLFTRHPGDWYLHILASEAFPLGMSGLLPMRILHLQKAGRLAPKLPMPDLLLGRSFAAVGRVDDALVHYRHGVMKFPASRSLVSLYKELAAFRVSLQQMAALTPQEPARQLELARYLVLNQGRQGAKMALKLCSERENRDDAFAEDRLFLKSLALFKLNRLADASLQADAMMVKYPHDYRGYWVSGRIEEEEERYQRALHYYGLALQRKAPVLKVWPRMAECELRLNHPDDARIWAKKLQMLSWKHSQLKTDCRLLFADIAAQEGNLMQARSECLAIVRKEPNNMKALVRLARYAGQEGDWAQAARYLEKARPSIQSKALWQALTNWLQAGKGKP